MGFDDVGVDAVKDEGGGAAAPEGMAGVRLGVAARKGRGEVGPDPLDELQAGHRTGKAAGEAVHEKRVVGASSEAEPLEE